jgi:hypothetical protein
VTNSGTAQAAAQQVQQESTGSCCLAQGSSAALALDVCCSLFGCAGESISFLAGEEDGEGKDATSSSSIGRKLSSATNLNAGECGCC